MVDWTSTEIVDKRYTMYPVPCDYCSESDRAVPAAEYSVVDESGSCESLCEGCLHGLLGLDSL